MNKGNIIIGIVTLLVFVGIGWLAATQNTNTERLPPTSVAGHVEQSPASHILSEPMSEAIQKHMLEHADGEGNPGVIVQYNCTDFTCEDNLVEKLTAIVEDYPEYVYLAPNQYDGKIILTRFREREVMEEFDESAIRNFIE